MEKQIVSKQRVTDYGEVYTREREVNAMLDLVKLQTQSLDATFLEPACGTGNFLIEILRRKLVIAAQNYQGKGRRIAPRSQVSYERDLVLSVSSLYGIELLPSNVQHCRQRLLDYAIQEYTKLFPTTIKAECLATLECLLTLNIVHGNALTMEVEKTREVSPIEYLPVTQQEYAKKAIIFSQWSFINARKVKRVQFLYWGLVEKQYRTDGDNQTNAALPHPYRSVYQSSVCDFLEIGETYKEEYRNEQAKLQS
ncbi:DNA methyltransferase [Gallibacterium salpingitidis]|uniref:site-specific DNA-methyltransferase (adenine-specific) n=1 Tax=Gallibacterium salpingitidis TaxID=505341 RepID=A0A1A7NQK0_9PAST|nr:DNA methyltransferase [Gallibacterium salpingitidis]OBW91885.1 hypothetical protein QS62_09995 [Gallibacterium salpingitidis]